MFRFTIRDLLAATACVGALLLLSLATYRLHQDGWPWWWHTKALSQMLLNIGIGVAIGSLTACFAKGHEERAFLLATGAGLTAAALWFLMIAWLGVSGMYN